ncbi:hypothetical protein GH5_05135 [Leishmania sp. Ghana 2012 LV757]|uniref:hypothetical protein n=1 Tax=Leishmania sp. Ghana 2012 LV757 TaxID=2803181 RepID=UPI001B6F56C8|nr:hypothetical protein GH5_05135 [Leishmania sp. Ghana 2012 LV757]
MPPFSGKKKKEQLQAKRQRKRDEEELSKAREREREKLREELLQRGEDAAEEVLDALLRDRATLRDVARGRRGEKNAAASTCVRRNDGGSGDEANSGSNRGASSSDSSSECGREIRRSAPATMMYSADRNHGVRSVFVKESAAAIAVRRQLSYRPIPCRTTMPPTGIAFGEWFTFPSSASAAPAVVSSASAGLNSKLSGSGYGGHGGQMGAEEKLAVIAAEQQRRMERPLVTPAGDALGGVSSSIFFPFAVQLPSRGWHVGTGGRAVMEDACAITAGAGAASPQLQPGRPTAVAPQAAVSSDAEPLPRGGQEAAGCADQRNSSESAASGADTNDVGTPAADTGAATANVYQDGARFIKSIEEERFSLYMDCVDAYPCPAALAGLEVSSYERNLEVWQQLWRTVEQSDILVVVADARYPIIHAHLGLLTYIAKEQRKPCVFVLNKEDLVPASTLRCWQRFLYRYLDDLGFSVEPPDVAVPPGDKDTQSCNSEDSAQDVSSSGRIVLRTFTANPRPETVGQRDDDVDVTRRQKSRRRANTHMYEKLRTGRLNVAKHLGGGRHGAAHSNDAEANEEDDELRYGDTEVFVGMQAAQRALQRDRRAYKELEAVADKITELLATCRRLCSSACATAGGGNAAAVERSNAAPVSSPTYATSLLPCAAHATKAPRRGDDTGTESSDVAVEDRPPDMPSYLHIGFIGHPNVGKSSLLNCIRGTKVVSVSATPGHTKHVQTIPVPEEHLTLIDSPGLALPVFGVPRPLQAVLGTHQIAQIRDPQTSISFLAAYLPIEKLYGLQRPEYALQESGWSSYELCEAYAKKRGLFVKHGKGTLDVHRAAIALLQEAYEGRLALFYAPPELNLLQSAWYRECVRPHLLLPVFKPALLAST